jgi:glycosyltransferase involved in cell wall biosynthesis
VKSIAEAMVKLGHKVDVIAPFDPEIKPIDTKGVSIHRFKYSWLKSLHIMGHARALEADVRLRPLAFFLLPFYLLAAFISLWRVTGQQKSDVIHVHWVLPNGPVAACVAGLRHIPFLVSLHGSDIYVAHKNIIFGKVARWVFRRSAAVTACSPELREGALSLGAPENTRLLAWGADPDIFSPKRRSNNYRQLNGWTEEETIISSLGRFVHKKGFDRLVTAWGNIQQRHPAVRLVLGGDGLLRHELERQAIQLGVSERVNFPGRISWDEVPDFLAASDIFVLPSIRDAQGNMDGLPTVLLEAMASGVAVIASRLGGVPLVIESGKNGLLVTPGDNQELSLVLERLISHPEERQSLAREARLNVENIFNWENVAQIFIGMMEKIAHG